MKELLLLIACVALASALSKPFELRHGPPPPPPADREARAPVWRTFVARQDNFDPNNNNTFNMRYVENDQFHTPGKPIFIMLGGEWTIDEHYVQGGSMFDMAREYSGAMFYTEHRYYGESFPVKDFSTYNLRFLTVEQALYDVALFIKTLKQNPNFKNSRVVVIGISYSGNMAIWMRSKYPDLVYAAWSSSAPVVAKADFFEFAEVVAQDLSECISIIDNGVKEIQRLLQSSAGIQKVSRDFNVCRTLDVNDPGDMYMFYVNVFNKFSVQYSTTESLKDICNKLNNPNYASDYDKLAAYFTTPPACVSNYKHHVEWIQQIGLDGPRYRRWFYQTCNEFGTFQTTTSPNQPFVGVSVQAYYKQCRDVFGTAWLSIWVIMYVCQLNSFTPEFINAGIAATNKRYGGLNPNVTRVISAHGTYDPWHPLGLTKDLNKDAPVIIIPDVPHTWDMGPIDPTDPPALVDAKMRIQRTIREWLAL